MEDEIFVERAGSLAPLLALFIGGGVKGRSRNGKADSASQFSDEARGQEPYRQVL
jgi:hypothetical protein